MRLSGLFIYPIKSARGIALSEARLTPRGLAHDRRFMIVDQDGLFVTQREVPLMARLATSIEGDQLRVGFSDQSLLVALSPHEGDLVQVKVWRDSVQALDCGASAAAFVSAALRRSVRLVYMPDDSPRQVQLEYAEPGDSVSFADGFPYLLTNQGSLDELNTRLGEPVPMGRFRPNIVLEGAPAYAEDSWSRLLIAGIAFEVRKPCTRCVIITTDQLSGERAGKEPLKTLASYHTWHGKSTFGQNLLCRDEGTLRVGDPITVMG